MRFSLTEKERAPAIGARCVRQLLRHSSCRACVESCPVQAIALSDGKITLNADACLRCGECLFACPTAAIAGIDAPSRRYQGDTLVAPFSPLAPNTRELLIWHRLYHIRAVACDAEKHPGWALAVARLNLVLRGWQEPGWRLVPPVRGDVDNARRALLHAGTAQSARVPSGRRVLRELYPQISETIPVIHIPQCELCGACSRVCPESALRIEENAFIIDSAHCTHCGNCEAVCQYQALTLEEGPRHEPPGALPLVKLRCQSCQRPFAAWENHSAVCPTCRQHRHGMRNNCC